MSHPDRLRHLLNAVAAGQVDPEAALADLRQLSYEAVNDFAKVDHDRARRTGFPEVVWGQDKTAEQIAQILLRLGDRQPVVMATRVTAEKYGEIRALVRVSDRELRYFPMARICALLPTPIAGEMTLGQAMSLGKAGQQPGLIGILTAGTADLPVAEEAAVTAELMGFKVDRLWDVGVAGIQRLLDNRSVIDRADVLIVVAGMEGALPSVVGGLANCPVIAVPTSVGYGASFGGLAALLGMLNSCATGVGVVNIDNGFGAAMLAGQMLRMAGRLGRGSTTQDLRGF